MLWLGQIYTDADDIDNDNDNDNNANDDDNDTWWTNHDCIGSLACMPNEPKKTQSNICKTLSVCDYISICSAIWWVARLSNRDEIKREHSIAVCM